MKTRFKRATKAEFAKMSVAKRKEYLEAYRRFIDNEGYLKKESEVERPNDFSEEGE